MLVFPKWTNGIRVVIAIVGATAPLYVVLLVAFGASPSATDVGYQPVQPVAYSHELHVGELGLDCRYCHTTVETGAHATIPPTKICMNCHARIFGQSDRLSLVRQSYAGGMPIEWVRVHDLPDYAYFDHSAHVRRGVGCVSCHGRVDKMDESGVYQAEPLSMGWCLDCHRQPAPHLRPLDAVTAMDWAPSEDPLAIGPRREAAGAVSPPDDCAACHR
ncbi:MAG: cytochrome C [Phycisphaerae bacterium]|nr:cytochrome C [Phycisphaerae bacterium]